jgi:hypothetical protein
MITRDEFAIITQFPVPVNRFSGMGTGATALAPIVSAASAPSEAVNKKAGTSMLVSRRQIDRKRVCGGKGSRPRKGKQEALHLYELIARDPLQQPGGD